MENSTKLINRQLLLNDNQQTSINDVNSSLIDHNLDVKNCKNNHQDNRYDRDIFKNFNQVRNFFPVTEVKFSDSKYFESPNENNNNNNNNNHSNISSHHHHNDINCYTVRGDLNDVTRPAASVKNETNEFNGPKLKIKRFNSIDGDSILSAATSTTAINKKKRIPDGGFGWVIVFASFVISLIIDGIAFSFGLIFTELLHYFKESKTKTAWIGAFHLSVPLLAGPILSNLVDKYGCRVMTIIGGLIAGIGFVLSALSNSVEMLYLTFGLISGFGIGIGYVTAVVSIAFWFDKKSILIFTL